MPSELTFLSFPRHVLQLGDRGVAELQQTVWKDGDANPLSQLRPAVGRQHHALHPQQALQRRPARDSQILQPTLLPHPVESGTVVTGTQAARGSSQKSNGGNGKCLAVFGFLQENACADIFLY